MRPVQAVALQGSLLHSSMQQWMGSWSADASMAAALPEAQAAAAAAAPQPPTAPAANPVATHGDTDQMMREVTGQDQPIPMGMPSSNPA